MLNSLKYNPEDHTDDVPNMIHIDTLIEDMQNNQRKFSSKKDMTKEEAE